MLSMVPPFSSLVEYVHVGEHGGVSQIGTPSAERQGNGEHPTIEVEEMRLPSETIATKLGLSWTSRDHQFSCSLGKKCPLYTPVP